MTRMLICLFLFLTLVAIGCQRPATLDRTPHAYPGDPNVPVVPQ